MHPKTWDVWSPGDIRDASPGFPPFDFHLDGKTNTEGPDRRHLRFSEPFLAPGLLTHSRSTTSHKNTPIFIQMEVPSEKQSHDLDTKSNFVGGSCYKS